MKFLAKREIVPAALIVLAFIAGIIESQYFLNVRYLLNATSLYVEGGLLALGMTFVIVAAEIDLSVASMLALVAAVAAKLLAAGYPILIVFPLSIALGAALGWFNGVLVARLRLPSFVVTLGTLAAYRGVTQVLLGAASTKIPASLVGIDYADIPGTPIPLPLTILIVVAVVMGLILHRTVFGRWVYTVGSNQRASFFSGVPTARVKTAVFVISGVMAALAGLMIDSRLGLAHYDHADGLELDAITAVVLGGASIYGGEGSILGSMLALLLIALIRTGLGLANVTAEYQIAAVGALLIVSVLVGNLRERLVSSRQGKTPRTPSLLTMSQTASESSP